MLPDIAHMYISNVMHRRLFPVQYRFTYRIFGFLINLNQLNNLSKTSFLLSYNRFNIFSFYESDHGRRDGSSLTQWAAQQLASQGMESDNLKIYLHCMPRVLGYTFNPISYWFCYSSENQLLAVLVEVHNTFGDQHTYFLPARDVDVSDSVRASKPKNFHVSPFINMQAHYQFRISQPDETFSAMIREQQDERLMLVAGQHGKRSNISNTSLLKAFFFLPLMTLKVMTMIHWQAVKIYFKGGTFHRRPKPPVEEVS